MNQLYFIPETEKGELQNWLAGRTDVAGVLQTEELGKRYFRDVRTGNQIELTAGPKEKKTFNRGAEKLSAMAYETVADWLTEAPENPEIKWLVIDGIGHLELRKEGLHLLMENMVLGALPGVNVVLVIADEVVEKVLKRYQLKSRAQQFGFGQ